MQFYSRIKQMQFKCAFLFAYKGETNITLIRKASAKGRITNLTNKTTLKI